MESEDQIFQNYHKNYRKEDLKIQEVKNEEAT